MKLGTFSYLPAMTPQQVRKQAEYVVARGWNAAIEHVEPKHAADTYWTMWRLPMFGEKSVERIIAEADACHDAHPAHHVRLVAYDHLRQTLGTVMVLYRAKSA